jgi:hypothetical protein
MRLRTILSVLSVGLSLAGCEDPKIVVGDKDQELTVLCRRGGDCGKVMHAANKLDLLLVVDNSFSMEQEQAALAAELPRMMNALLTGDIDGDGTPEVAPVKDIHVGVVSTDMGIGDYREEYRIENCGAHGDDGVLVQGGLGVPTCTPPEAGFLSYDAALEDYDAAVHELSCLSTLGLDGCGFEQQLESALKAVTPSTSNIAFYTEDGLATGGGQGDTANAGFLRNDPDDPSLLAVLLITDEEDCSSRDPSHFNPIDSLSGLNTRCYYEAMEGAAGNLHPVQRYIDGLRALRPDHDNLVFFGAIAGVPLDAVSEEALADVDFADDAERDTFYNDLLAHPKMQGEIDEKDTPDVPEDDGMKPVCEAANGKAYPARRIVEVARGFGSNSVVQSICQESFTSAIEPILQRMAASFSGACIDAEYEREDDGKVACDVLWRLPEESMEGVPESCEDASFLSPAGEGRAANVCRVAQLAVEDGRAPAGDGWYFDDFSDRTRWCEGDSKQAIVFTGEARPPSEVTILIDCEE